MVSQNVFSVLCDIAGVAGFGLALFQHLGSRTRFRISDVHVHLIGHSGSFLHCCVSMTVTNNSSRALAIEALHLSVSGGAAFPPLSSIQATSLCRCLHPEDREDIDRVESADAVPVLLPAHAVSRISLLYRMRTQELLEPLMEFHARSVSSTPCKSCESSREIPILSDYLDLVFSVRGRTVHRKVAPGNVSFSGFSAYTRQG